MIGLKSLVYVENFEVEKALTDLLIIFPTWIFPTRHLHQPHEECIEISDVIF